MSYIKKQGAMKESGTIASKLQDFRHINNGYSRDNSASIVEILETAFAKEITFLYYLNLHNDTYIPILFPNPGALTMIVESTLAQIRKASQNSEGLDFLSNKSSSVLPLSPKEKLAKILRQIRI